jgi:hypothetical protein
MRQSTQYAIVACLVISGALYLLLRYLFNSARSLPGRVFNLLHRNHAGAKELARAEVAKPCGQCKWPREASEKSKRA